MGNEPLHHRSTGLATFDEESCRYFLNNLGTRLVPAFPFSLGIEEVYSIILREYDWREIPDLMSLLQELLEDDQNAAGLGDDGDVWRSWRHNWRHRNHDPLHPFIARVGRVVLPLPTPVLVRRLRAERFIRRTWPGQVHIEQVSQSPEVNLVGGQRADSVGMSDLAQVDLVPQQSSTSQRPPLKPGESAASSSDPARTEPELSEVCHIGGQDSMGSLAIITRAAAQAEAIVSKDECLSRTTEGCETKASNREARLIDGTIFTVRRKRSKTIDQVQDDVVQESETRKRLSRRASLSVVSQTQRETCRASWFRGFRRLLRSRNQNKHRSTGPSDASFEDTTNYRQPHNLGLDGTMDTTHESSVSMDLNKPLPLNPEDIVRSMSSRAGTNGSTNSRKSTKATSSNSTQSPVLSEDLSRSDPANPGRFSRNSDPLQWHSLYPLNETDVDDELLSDPKKSSTADLRRASSYKDSTNGHSSNFGAPPGSPVGVPFPLMLHRIRDVMTEDAHGLVPSLSAPVLCDAGNSNYRAAQHAWPEKATKSPRTVRGRTKPLVTEVSEDESGVVADFPGSKPRSRSPVKRLLDWSKNGNAKSASTDEIPAALKTPQSSSKKSSLKKWGDRFRYGFLTADQEQMRQEELAEQHLKQSATPPSQRSTFPVTLDPPLQARLQCEVELLVTTIANRYLLREAATKRLSAESVARVKEQWQARGRPEVIEFHYDQMTQHDLIVSNLKTVKLHGDAAKDPIALNSTLYSWKIMAREMSLRTFCCPDSVIRKHLHDAHRVLELLGASAPSVLHYENFQLKVLAEMTRRQAKRVRRRTGESTSCPEHRRSTSDSSYLISSTLDYDHVFGKSGWHIPVDDVVTPTPAPLHPPSPPPLPPPFFTTPTRTGRQPTSQRPRSKTRKATGAEGVLMTPTPPKARTCPRSEAFHQDPFNNSRGGRLGKAIREKPELIL